MKILLFLLFCFSVSVDSFSVGVAYGIKNTKVGKKSKVQMGIVSFCLEIIAVFFSSVILLFLPEAFSKYIGGGIMILLGLFIIVHGILDKSMFDFNEDKVVEGKEAIFMGLALSMDAFFMGICFCVSNDTNYFLPVGVAICQIGAITLGNKVGKTLLKHTGGTTQLFIFLSGIIIIMMGVFSILFE